MAKPRTKKRPPKRVLALSDLEESEAAVLNRLTSQSGQRTYDRAITDFVACYCSGPRLAFNRHQDSVQLREEHWVIADLLGKAGHIRTPTALLTARSFVLSTRLGGSGAME